MNNRFTDVPGFSDRRRIPLLGKIRLGHKIKNSKGVEYPKETDYFIVPAEVAKVYGEKPKQLDVFLPSADRGLTIPCSLRRYGSTAGLKCIGNKSVAYDIVEKKDIACPCKYFTAEDETGKACKKECSQVGFLFVILYKVNLGGVYQIRTTSGNSVTDIKSGMDYVEGMLQRPCSMIPLTLKREPTETHHQQKKQIHYTMRLNFPDNFNIENANLLVNKTKYLFSDNYALPAPADENPIVEKADIVEAQGIKDEEKQEQTEETQQDNSEAIAKINNQIQEICTKMGMSYDGYLNNIKKYMAKKKITDENTLTLEHWQEILIAFENFAKSKREN